MAVLNRFPTGGGIPDDLNTTPAEVLEGFKFIGSLQDDIEVGTLKLTGNANSQHVLKNQTFYTTNPKEKEAGKLEVNNISNFILTLSGGRNIVAQWTNPQVQTGRPYSGVYIKYQTGSYPSINSGTQAYKGVGSNQNPSAVSQVNLVLPALNTTYYFICYSYCVTSNGELLGEQLKATVRTGTIQTISINFTQNYTIPAGYNSIDIFCVGGGGGGGAGYRFTGIAYEQGGGGGGGGYTATALNIGVAAGQIMNCVIGNGGGQNTAINGPGGTGGTTSVSRGGIVLCTANGGKGGDGASGASGGYGGSRGGSGGYNDLESRPVIRAGGNGYADGAGTGSQGYTTRAFGEAGNTLYAGGGGGGGVSRSNPGAGGAGGGGAGGAHNGTGNAGAANTGGGGGGGGGAVYGTAIAGGPGGSGVVLIRLK